MILSDIATVFRVIENPEKYKSDVLVDHYSLPAFDKGACQRVLSSKVKSQKQVVPENAILVSRLNPHIPRVWAPEIDPNIINLASTEWSVLIPKGVERGFLHGFFESDYFKIVLRAGVTGTSNSHQRVPVDHLMEIEVPEFDSALTQRGTILPNNVSQQRPRLRKLAAHLHTLATHTFNQIFYSSVHPENNRLRIFMPRNNAKITKLQRLGDFVSLQKGLSYESKQLSQSEGKLLMNLKSVKPTTDVLKTGFKRYIGGHRERDIVKGGDILIANTDITQFWEVLGHPAIVPFSTEGEILYTCDLSAVRRKSECPIGNMTLFHLFNDPMSRARCQGWATGTTVQRIPEETLLDIEIQLPSQPVLDELESKLETIYRCIDKIYSLERKATEIVSKNANLMFPVY